MLSGPTASPGYSARHQSAHHPSAGRCSRRRSSMHRLLQQGQSLPSSTCSRRRLREHPATRARRHSSFGRLGTSARSSQRRHPCLTALLSRLPCAALQDHVSACRRARRCLIGGRGFSTMAAACSLSAQYCLGWLSRAYLGCCGQASGYEMGLCRSPPVRCTS